MIALNASEFPILGRLRAFLRFAGGSRFGRSIVVLLAGIFVLLLTVNISALLLIRHTAEINAEVDRTWQIRRANRGVLVHVGEAEAAQRGFLLTGQGRLVGQYDNAREAAIAALRALDGLTQEDARTQRAVVRLAGTVEAKFEEMSGTFIAVRQGRIGEAVSLVRTGEGQLLMDRLREVVDLIDTRQGERVTDLTAEARASANWTIAVNAASGVLILLLGALIALLVRRYLRDVADARDALDRANAGLEEKVRARTAALSRANEEVQRFAYIVSHDLRSPLVNVMGYTSELEQAGKALVSQIEVVEAEAPQLVSDDARLAVREDIPEAVGFIRASTEKMDRLINAILKLSREGRRNLVSETLDMDAMVGRIADSVSHQLSEAGAEIVVEPLPSFENDRLSIEQIMGNLIDNAVKYLDASRPGRIVVSGHEVTGGWVEYEVRDNGRGIADRDRERVFELFRRAGRQDRPGEGLGLAFVRNSVRRLNGTIDLESELGKGSTFRLKFPKRLVLSDIGDDL
jgi:signal transduction histidine kinase